LVFFFFPGEALAGAGFALAGRDGAFGIVPAPLALAGAPLCKANGEPATAIAPVPVPVPVLVDVPTVNVCEA
jgi:hypothetical protein